MNKKLRNLENVKLLKHLELCDLKLNARLAQTFIAISLYMYCFNVKKEINELSQ